MIIDGLESMSELPQILAGVEKDIRVSTTQVCAPCLERHFDIFVGCLSRAQYW